VTSARTHDLARHGSGMCRIVTSPLLIAGGLIFPFGRIAETRLLARTSVCAPLSYKHRA
jgi:hypothetical protein